MCRDPREEGRTRAKLRVFPKRAKDIKARELWDSCSQWWDWVGAYREAKLGPEVASRFVRKTNRKQIGVGGGKTAKIGVWVPMQVLVARRSSSEIPVYDLKNFYRRCSSLLELDYLERENGRKGGKQKIKPNKERSVLRF